MGWGLIPRRGKILLFSIASRLALGPTQPPIQWAPGALSLGVKLTTHLRLVPPRWKSGILPIVQNIYAGRNHVESQQKYMLKLKFRKKYTNPG
jgi:hypothetical protein